MSATNGKEAFHLATIDRFKEAIDKGMISVGGGAAAPLSAQMKYDYLAAIHTMEQLTTLAAEIENRNSYREKLKRELLKSCCQSLKKLADDEDNLTLRKIEAAIKMLLDCRYEVAKIESATRESRKLSELIKDGVSAGH